MEKEITLIESLFDKAENYATTNVDLVTLKAVDKIADSSARLIATIIITSLIMLITMMLNIGAALWLGDITGNMFYGFFIVAGFYIVIALLIHFNRKAMIKDPVKNALIEHMVK